MPLNHRYKKLISQTNTMFVGMPSSFNISLNLNCDVLATTGAESHKLVCTLTTCVTRLFNVHSKSMIDSVTITWHLLLPWPCVFVGFFYHLYQDINLLDASGSYIESNNLSNNTLLFLSLFKSSLSRIYQVSHCLRSQSQRNWTWQWK